MPEQPPLNAWFVDYHEFNSNRCRSRFTHPGKYLCVGTCETCGFRKVASSPTSDAFDDLFIGEHHAPDCVEIPLARVGFNHGFFGEAYSLENCSRVSPSWPGIVGVPGAEDGGEL